MRVLLVDDDAEQLSLRSLLLRRNGLETLEASEARSAVALASVERPSCAVVDLRLPTVELGLKLIRDLKKIDPGMHILVLTGINSGGLARSPERKLVDQVIVKGSPSSQLIHALKRIAA
jgi:CheY-like chemotaxis protein